jgi:hypothetical protein
MKNNICNIKNNTYICNIIKEFDMFTLNMCEIFFQDIIWLYWPSLDQGAKH